MERFENFTADELRHIANGLRGEIAFLTTHGKDWPESPARQAEAQALLDEVEAAAR